MQGLLSDLPLMGILELVHSTRQTGVLDVRSGVPCTVTFVGGEIISGGILDWMGLDALYASPLLPDSGTFDFTQRPVAGQPLGPYGHLTTDWARVSDEWERVCAVIGSPSHWFRGDVFPFSSAGGCSVRSAARELNIPVFQAAQMVVTALRQGKLTPQNRQEWHRLRLQPAGQRARSHPVARQLNGKITLGEAIDSGLAQNDVRDYLLAELRLGLRFPGSGWVLRDLIWEQQYSPVTATPAPLLAGSRAAG
ncbi:DUF4388 domain-containing protein [Deinococcus arenicola]|uniref:DUF4388 domain-containing protein n=1 Tax=Deinococcus arenicola TaxID=2994950 RepID=A0ABU4DTP4_9DEIO|nr:DUF4388 domain-containing protein [Deinococcus sp. ZS9-10]MDV6375806.1 DUF4388 domain-containing protein [Deinococcus sp. ZS9-10]